MAMAPDSNDSLFEQNSEPQTSIYLDVWLSAICGLYYKIYNFVFTPVDRSQEVSVESIHR